MILVAAAVVPRPVFDTTSREFMEAVRFRPRLALDLGCGPGHSTHLLAEVTGAARTVGVDCSGVFLVAARETAFEHWEWQFPHNLGSGPPPTVSSARSSSSTLSP
ncbi:MAG: methyltransferase domain-containing protein [Actinomycetota bacterium]|nr:methyltransferase domain-containing protein [Actinomycetota bacterium]